MSNMLLFLLVIDKSEPCRKCAVVGTVRNQRSTLPSGGKDHNACAKVLRVQGRAYRTTEGIATAFLVGTSSIRCDFSHSLAGLQGVKEL